MGPSNNVLDGDARRRHLANTMHRSLRRPRCGCGLRYRYCSDRPPTCTSTTNLTFLAVPLHSATKSLRLRIILMSLLKITTCFQQKSLAKISDVTIIFGSPSKHSLHSVITVLIHNSGHFGPPLPFWAPGPPALPGLPMASYATGKNTKRLKRKTRHN